MTYDEPLMMRAEALWRALAKAKWKAEGKGELIARLLTLKFGSLSAEQAERIRSACLYDLDRWAERILTAGTIDEVFA